MMDIGTKVRFKDGDKRIYEVKGVYDKRLEGDKTYKERRIGIKDSRGLLWMAKVDADSLELAS